jgi:hypothetical protein
MVGNNIICFLRPLWWRSFVFTEVKQVFQVILLRSRKLYMLRRTGSDDANRYTCIISSNGFCFGSGVTIEFSENKGVVVEVASLSFSSRLPRNASRNFPIWETRRRSRSRTSKTWTY